MAVWIEKRSKTQKKMILILLPLVMLYSFLGWYFISDIFYPILNPGVQPDRISILSVCYEFIETAILTLVSFFLGDLAIRKWNFTDSKTFRTVALFVVLPIAELLISAFLSSPYAIFGDFSFDDYLLCVMYDALIVSMATTIFMFSAHDDIRKEQEKMLEESERKAKALALAQMDSLNLKLNNHFIFNCFNVLSSLMNSDVKKANDFLLAITDIYRQITIMTKETTVPIAEELRIAKQYLQICSVRFGDQAILVDFSDDLQEMAKEDIVPLTLMELLENAIKHNAYSEEEPLRIRLSVESIDGEDYIVVENNIAEKSSKLASTKQGLGNLSRKYSLICGMAVQIIRTETKFIVKIPVIHKWK